MGVTGYENLTDEEIIVKLEKIKIAQYNLEREQRHRKEKEKEERYKDIIGKIFYCKGASVLAKVTGIREPDVIGLTEEDVTKYKFICNTIYYEDDAGKYMMQQDFHKGFRVYYGMVYDAFDAEDWENVDEARAEEILGRWKQHINNVRL